MNEEGSRPHPVDPELVEEAQALVLSAPEAEELGQLFRLLGDPVRARIVSALDAVDEMCVGDIGLAIGIRENSVSYALRQLRAAGLVGRRRRGREIYYSLQNPRLSDLIEGARLAAGTSGD